MASASACGKARGAAVAHPAAMPHHSSAAASNRRRARHVRRILPLRAVSSTTMASNSNA